MIVKSGCLNLYIKKEKKIFPFVQRGVSCKVCWMCIENNDHVKENKVVFYSYTFSISKFCPWFVFQWISSNRNDRQQVANSFSILLKMSPIGPNMCLKLTATFHIKIPNGWTNPLKNMDKNGLQKNSPKVPTIPTINGWRMCLSINFKASMSNSIAILVIILITPKNSW